MTTISKTGGASSSGVAGGIEGTEQTSLDQTQWVTSLFRTLAWYVNNNSDGDIYEVIFEFPSDSKLGELMPLGKTIIHFESDNINNTLLGFGDGTVAITYNTMDQVFTRTEGQCHDINFDVGVWSSNLSGGVTARLNAYQLLNDLFCGPSAFENAAAIGIEIQSFNGASFIKEEINDQDVYRIMGMTLALRIYSTKVFGGIPYIGDFIIDQELTDSDGNPLTND